MHLSSEFFNRNTVIVARQLLGKYLIRKGKKNISAKIIETEAYHGLDDKASHASRGITLRTKIMFGPPGTTYVYLIYGMYHCLNFVTMRKGFPAAVLIRAISAKGGDGPGKLCCMLHIDKRLNGLDTENNQIWVEDKGEYISPRDIKRNKRIGIEYAGKYKDKLWRFTLMR